MSGIGTTIAASATSAATKAAILALGKRLLQVVKKSLSPDQIKRWEQSNHEELFIYATDVRMVKTILHLETPADLNDFYHPARIGGGKAVIQPDATSDLPLVQLLVIEAPVGRGKSILLRRLTSNDLIKGEVLPILIELRTFVENSALLKEISKHLEFLGLPTPIDAVPSLLETGNVVLLLDGFDELSWSLQKQLTEVLENLLKNYKKLRVIVTTRPDTSITYSRKSLVRELLELQPNEWPALIRRFETSTYVQNRIIAEVSKNASIREVLTTPLMVALLVLRYRLEQSVPENTLSFYSNLFHLLLDRHDKISKAGYTRVRVSRLADAELERAFNAMCWLSCKLESVTFDRQVAFKRAERALRAAHARTTDPGAFLHDITGITGLLMEEGGEYSFVHKSVVEYHAALCIRSLSDDLAERFYRAVLDKPKDTALWGILSFLKQLDRDRYMIYFWRPLLRAILSPRHERTLNVPRSPVSGMSQGMLEAAYSLLERMPLVRLGATDEERKFLEASEALYRRFDMNSLDAYPDDIMSRGSGTREAVLAWTRELASALQRADSEIEGVMQRVDVLLLGD